VCLVGAAAMEDVLRLVRDSRLCAAKTEYEKILQDPVLDEQQKALIHLHRQELAQLTERCEQVNEALALVSKSNEKWILATNMLGVTTHYLIGDDGLLWVRMESTQHDVPLLEQLAVVYEVGLFNNWIPFCSESSLIARPSIPPFSPTLF
jgi:hypothetical protein